MNTFLLIAALVLLMFLLKKKEVIVYQTLINHHSSYCDKIKLKSFQDTKIPHWGILYQCSEETTWFHQNGTTKQTLINAKVAFENKNKDDYLFTNMQVLMMTSDGVCAKDGWLGVYSKNETKNELNLIVPDSGYHYIREALINKKNDGLLLIMTDQKNQFKLGSSKLSHGFLLDTVSSNPHLISA